MIARVPPAEFRALPLEAHALLANVPLHDVTAVDLPGGGPGRTLTDVRALSPMGGLMRANPVTRALFGLRLWLGRVFGWDRAEHDRAGTSYLPRVSDALRARSAVAPGTMEMGFRLLYLLDDESLSEIHNATVHAFLCAALRQAPGGHRLYWGIYVRPTSRLTPVYMALIEPFRRFLVYPAMFARLRRAWISRYPTNEAAAVDTPAARPDAGYIEGTAHGPGGTQHPENSGGREGPGSGQRRRVVGE
jgi:hypothetical protein